jgi:hypothetical protein
MVIAFGEIGAEIMLGLGDRDPEFMVGCGVLES